MLLKTGVPIPFILGKVKRELPLIAIYAFGITFLVEFLEVKGIAIPLAIPGILGTAISLILAFRTNQAYERWWEARKVWGAIVNDSRTLVRQAQAGSGKPEGDKFIKRIANRQIGWCYALSGSLRRLDASEGLDKYLGQDELDRVKAHKNIPNAILSEHNRDILKAKRDGVIDDFEYLQLDRTTRRLTDSMGMCERIKNTVFPTTYSLFVEILLVIFVLLLPLGIVEYSGYFEPLVVVVVTIPFFLLEKSAISMQDPFENRPTDTPMTTISRGIEMNIHHMMGEMDTIADPKNKEYYQL